MEKEKGKRRISLTSDECTEIPVMGETSRPFNSYALKATMKGAWKLNNGFVFRELRQNLFLFQSGSEEDKEKVIKGSPWAFDRALFALMKPAGHNSAIKDQV